MSFADLYEADMAISFVHNAGASAGADCGVHSGGTIVRKEFRKIRGCG